MRKSFTRLLSLVMLFGVFQLSAVAQGGIDPTTVWPEDNAYTKTSEGLTITYAEDVVASTGAIRLSDASGILKVISATDTTVTIIGGVVTVDVTGELKELTVYDVALDGDAFETADGGVGSVSSYSWSFMTGDYTAPVLKSVVPKEESVVGENMIDLVLTFEDNSKIFQAGGNVTVYKEDGNVWDLVTVPAGAELVDGVLLVEGVRKLEDETNYAVTIDAGVVEDEGLTEDESANPYAGLMDRTVWVFSTIDFTAPGWADKYPKSDNIAATTFDVLVKTTEDGTVYALLGEKDVALDPSIDADDVRTDGDSETLAVVDGVEGSFSFTGEERGTYVVYLIADNDDTETDEVVETVTVTLGETDAPYFDVVYYIYKDVSPDPSEEPGDYEEGEVTNNFVNPTPSGDVDLDLVQMVLEFDDPEGADEKLVLGAGNIIIKKLEDNEVFATIPSTDMSVYESPYSNDAFLSFEVSGLENGVEYYVTIPGTLVMDEWGNKYEGISNSTDWRFIAADDIAPTYTVVPAQAATDVKGDAEVVITFDEVVDAEAGDFLLLKDSQNPDDHSGYDFDFDRDDNSGKFSVVTLTVNDGELDDPNMFPSESIIQIVVQEDEIEDESGNAVSDNQYVSTYFFVEDYAGPEFVKWVPAATDPGELESGMTPIAMVFDEGIQLLGGTEITADNLYALITVKNDDESGSNVAVTYAISDDKSTVSVMPVAEWASEKTYYVSISSDIEDLNGNPYEGSDRAETFKAVDLVQEEIVFEAGGDEFDGETISTTAAITMTFDDDEVAAVWNKGWNAYTEADVEKAVILKMNDANGVDVPFALDGDANKFNIVPNPALEMGKTYYLAIGAVLADDGENVADAEAITFMTLNEGAPKLTSTDPADKAKQVAKKTDVVFTFDVDIETPSYVAGGVTVTVDGVDSLLNATDFTIKDNTLTIDEYPFGENAAVSIEIAADVIFNVDDPTGLLDFAGKTIVFSTVDTELDLVSIAPDMDLDLDYSDGVDIDEKLVIVFGEDVEVGAGNIDIINYNTDFTIERIAVSADNVTIKDDKVTIVASELFKYAADFYVELNEGAFVDEYGNKSPEIFGKGNVDSLDWTFQTADPDLVVKTTSPADGDDKVAIDAPIVVNFNREIKLGTTGSVGYAVKNGDDWDPEVYTIDSDNLSIDGKTLTILHPNNEFGENDTVALYLDAEALIPVTGSAAGNVAYGPAGEEILWYTGNANAPEATYDPEDEDDKVETDVVVSISFDEDIYSVATGDQITLPVQVTDGNIFDLKEEDGTPVSFVGGVSGNTVTLTPDVDLDEYSTYFIEIYDGTLADELGNISEADTSWFETTDYTAPVVVISNIVGGDKKITFDVDVTDNSKVDKFYYLERVKTADAAPTAEEIMADGTEVESTNNEIHKSIEIKKLNSSTTYEVFYVAKDKTFGNVSDVEMFEEATNDTDKPVLVSTDPESGSVDIEVAAGGTIAVELTFSEPVEIGISTTDSIIIRDQATGAMVGAVGLDSLSTTEDEEVLMLTLSGFDVADNPVAFYFEMPDSSVVDTVGNKFAGIFGEDGIYLTTADQKKPTIKTKNGEITGGPLEYTMEIGVGDNIEVTFSEAVAAGAGKAILYTHIDLDGSDAVQIFKGDDLVIDGKVLTLNPTALLDLDETPYYLQLNDDVVQDLAGNEFDSVRVELNVVTDGTPYITDIYVDDVGSWVPGDEVDPIHKDDLEEFDFDFSENVYLVENGIYTSVMLLTDDIIKANGIVTLEDAAGNAVDFVMDQCCPDDVVFDVDDKDFDHSTSYTVTIQGLSDSKGNMMEPFTWTFETTDGMVPVAMFNPADKEEDVMEDAPLTITFSEKIYRAIYTEDVPEGDDFTLVAEKSAQIDEDPEFIFYVPFTDENIHTVVYLKAYDSDGDYMGEIPFTATIENDSLITIIPDEALESEWSYGYGFEAWNIVDSDNQNPSKTDPNCWAVFTVRDYVAPTFDVEEDVAPEMGETSVVANKKMWIDFSEDIMVGEGSVIIRNVDGTYSEEVSGSGLSIDADKAYRLKIAHDNFPANEEFFVELTTGVVTDKAGNESAAYVDAEFGWVFTTKDTYTLEALASPMGPNQPEVVNLVLTFNKEVAAATSDVGYYVAVYKADGTAVAQIAAEDLVILGNVVTFYGLVLEKDQEYYARVEPKSYYDKNESSNKFAGIMDDSWEFSTMASIAPQLLSVTPDDNSTAVDPATSFTMTFDRDVAAGTGNIDVRYLVDGELFEAVDVTTATFEGATVTFTLSTLLDAQTEFYILVADGAITNTEPTADAWEGINNTYDWNITTGDVIVYPELESYTPQDTIEGTHPEFVMTFAENVMLGEAGTLTVTAKDSTEASLVIDLADAVIVDNVVTITYPTMPTDGLNVNTTYIVNVDAGALVNGDGNAWEGISNDTDWTFTTGADFTTDIELPVVEEFDFNVYPNPFNNYIKINNYDKLTRVVITNIAGQRVLDIEYPNSEIQTGNLVTGVYVVTLIDDGKIVKSERIIKR